MLEYSPSFSFEEATALARDLYGLDVAASALPSERDQNFLLQDRSGGKYVLKIANSLEDRALLEAQQQAMARVAERAPRGQRIAPTQSGALLSEIRSASGMRHFVWMVDWLPGVALGDLKRHSPELLRDLGRRVGRIDCALAEFDHQAIHRDFHWDLANGQSVIGQSVIGLIDFGDMVHSFTVADLAVAIAYAMLNKPDPLAVAAEIVKGYHAEYALIEDEIAALFGLARLRLCVSVCIGAHQRRLRPDDDYLTISQRPIRDT